MLFKTSSARYCSELPLSHRLKKSSNTGSSLPLPSRPGPSRTMAVRLLAVDEALLPPLPPPECSDRVKRVRRARAATSLEAVGARSKSARREGNMDSLGVVGMADSCGA